MSTRCARRTSSNRPCLRRVKHGRYCWQHQRYRGNVQLSLNDWLYKEVQRLTKLPGKKTCWISWEGGSVYMKGDSFVIWSIEEEDPINQYFIIYGKYPKKLKIKKIGIKCHESIESYIKDNYQGYRRAPKFDNTVKEASINI